MNVGFDKTRFPQLEGNQSYDCLICSQVIKEPKQCNKCGTLYCGACIDSWLTKSNTCLNRCVDFVIGPISAILQQLYNELIIKCEKCEKGIKLAYIVNHEMKCNGKKCWNHEICGVENNPEIQEGNCSKKCRILRQLLETKRDLKQMYLTIINYQPQTKILYTDQNTEQTTSWMVKDPARMEQEQIEMFRPRLQKASKSSPFEFGKKKELLVMRWDIPQQKKIRIQNNGTSFISEQTNYFRKSIATGNGFVNGRHYWELQIGRHCEHEFLTGVTKKKVNINSSFSDRDNGSFLIQSGKLIETDLGKRKSSIMTQSRIQASMRLIGIYLNMEKGTLCFSWNKKKIGLKIQSEHLKSGPLFPAISFSYEIECDITGEFQIPKQFEDD